MEYRIALLPGDGVGPEVVSGAVVVLGQVAIRYGRRFHFTEGLIGGCAMDAAGDPFPAESLALCRESHAVLLGAVGGPKWSDPRAAVRPEQGLLTLRKELGLYANLRPVAVEEGLTHGSTLKPEVVKGVDLVIVRELTGGLYFGRPQGERTGPAGREAVDTLFYTEEEIRRVVRVAFELARVRGRAHGRAKVTSVDKANVLATSRLWRTVAHEVASEYPDVPLEDQLVDSCAMQLIRRPADFDVIVTENTFGDILSDESSMLAGSMGMLPSASVAGFATQGPDGLVGHGGVYEPIHGSAPDIAGKGVANPLATILSAAMMLELAFGMQEEAAAVRSAVRRTLADGLRTADIMEPGFHLVGTRVMAEHVAASITD